MISLLFLCLMIAGSTLLDSWNALRSPSFSSSTFSTSEALNLSIIFVTQAKSCVARYETSKNVTLRLYLRVSASSSLMPLIDFIYQLSLAFPSPNPVCSLTLRRLAWSHVQRRATQLCHFSKLYCKHSGENSAVNNLYSFRETAWPSVLETLELFQERRTELPIYTIVLTMLAESRRKR